MKKKIIIPVILAIVVIGIVAAYLISHNTFGKKPFADLKPEDIAKVSVQLLPPGETVEITDFEELANALNEVVIYEKDDSYATYYGQGVIYTITMTDGKEITVNAYNPFIIIDGVGYKTEYEPCEKLSQIANTLID